MAIAEKVFFVVSPGLLGLSHDDLKIVQEILDEFVEEEEDASNNNAAGLIATQKNP